jgi:hypothetical protein
MSGVDPGQLQKKGGVIALPLLVEGCLFISAA